MKVSRDKDAELKIRTARYLWHMGYVCPIEVALSSREIKQGSLKRYDLTDIDVVGIRFDSDLASTTVIADCKTGRESAVNRLFWLRGVMDFFDADRGYLVMGHIGAECREVALRLRVSLLDEENLGNYERDKKLTDIRIASFTLEGYDREQDLWGLQKEKGVKPVGEEAKLEKLYAYLSYSYWFNEEYRNVQRLLAVLDDAAPAIKAHPDKVRMKVVSYSALTLWSISLLRMCGAIIATKSIDIHNEVRRYIFGGAATAVERAALMRQFSRITGERQLLEPAYYDELLELAARIIKFSQFAKNVPRYIELVLSESVVAANARNLDEILGHEFSLDTLKLAKDVAAFVSRSTHVDPAIFAELMSQ